MALILFQTASPDPSMLIVKLFSIYGNNMSRTGEKKKQSTNVIWRQMCFEKMSYPAKVSIGHIMMQISYNDVWIGSSNTRSWLRPHQNSISRKVSIFYSTYKYKTQPCRNSKHTVKCCLNMDASSNISFSLTAMPIPSFIKAGSLIYS